VLVLTATLPRGTDNVWTTHRSYRPRMTTIGILSPGAMGSAVGAAYLAGGARVVTSLTGRSPRSASLARAAGLEELPDLDAVVGASDVLLSIVPPGRAGEAGQAVVDAAARTTTRPLLVEANGVSPQTVARIAALGLEVVDGSISGGPPTALDSPRTRLYLSGPRAREVASVPAPWLDVRVAGGDVGTASAIKMCTASYYKGRNALAAQAMLTAAALGVTDVVLDDLGDLLPGPHGVGVAVSKAWRHVDEMREIAATQGAADMPPALFEGMGQVYAELARRAGDVAPEDVPAEMDWAALLEWLR
jgi:3-hydroxyisobutyrate dehydrogenase-like beta-hydroxyacid dehydrogenase